MSNFRSLENHSRFITGHVANTGSSTYDRRPTLAEAIRGIQQDQVNLTVNLFT